MRNIHFDNHTKLLGAIDAITQQELFIDSLIISGELCEVRKENLRKARARLFQSKYHIAEYLSGGKRNVGIS
jgi:hypothetical protein